MDIELSSGKTDENVSPESLKQYFQQLKNGEDFLILGDGEDYIQCAVSEDALLFEYQDAGGLYCSAETVSFETGEAILGDYLNRDPAWRTRTDWDRDSADGDSADGEPAGEENIVDTLKRSAMREIRRAVDRKSSGLVRNILRKIIK